jgi:alginate O-acetyltransferase complex protein AlgI
MLFSSPIFLFYYLPVLLALYSLLPRTARNGLLLIASLNFYAWGEQGYILVLVASIGLNYLFGLGVDHLAGRRAVTAMIALAVIVNLGLLGVFKYANFFVDNVNHLRAAWQLEPLQVASVHLPLGISFFTFHALSYVIDIYRRQVRALRNPVDFALYISFFPQSIAGPIVRYHDVADQLAERSITREGLAEGVRRFILGLGKKMLIANSLAAPADAIFGLAADQLTTPLAWLGLLCYTLQIYFDFSGYSDMAIGLARMFGFQFPENFAYPYVARSITEFWRRWHISLSTWYRDYLYIPLGGNRCRAGRVYANLVIVFCLCGLWHGASWTFVAWGLFHGSFLVIERLGLGRLLARAWTPIGHVYALAVVMLGWVLFRAETLPAALGFVRSLAGWSAASDGQPLGLHLNAEVALALLAGAIGCMPVLPLLVRARDRLVVLCASRVRTAVAVQTAWAFTGVAGCGVIFLASLMLLAAGTYNPFIYFRF